jgi:hypothetical protein
MTYTDELKTLARRMREAGGTQNTLACCVLLSLAGALLLDDEAALRRIAAVGNETSREALRRHGRLPSS